MRYVMGMILLLGYLGAWSAESPISLDDLVRQAREERVRENEALAAREQAFREAHDRQQALLEKLRTDLTAERELGEDLKRRYEENDKVINAESATLHEKTGSLGELFGVARQVAKDAQSLLGSSLVSAQKPKRDAVPAQLAERKDNPSIDELEQLWLALLDEMVESGKVARFSAAVTAPSGEQSNRDVLRLGTFNVVSGGRYLHYIPETGRLVELGRQPPARFLGMAQDLEQARSGIASMALDPSRGSILSLLVDAPSLTEHIQRAGIIGYVILALGGLALLIVLERFITLTRTRRTLEREKRSPTPSTDNPLGRLRSVSQQHPNMDADALALKLDQAVLIEVPRFKSLLPTLAVFATAAPLLGLLGTVAGMIDTFQSMSMFGAGDPKLVSGGISLALVATELGLLVAIPILLLHSWLHGASNQIIQALEEEMAALVAQREEHLHGASA